MIEFRDSNKDYFLEFIILKGYKKESWENRSDEIYKEFEEWVEENYPEEDKIDPDDYTDKHNALAKYLSVPQIDIEECKWGKDEYFEYGNQEYRVLTDNEADDAWDESLDNYLRECVYPEMPDCVHNYFDEESWKRDARMNGRGHSLGGYDGEENQAEYAGEWFYIYRTN